MELFFTAISGFSNLKRKAFPEDGGPVTDNDFFCLQLATVPLTHPNGRKEETTFLPSVCKYSFVIVCAIWGPSDAQVTC